MISEWIFGFVSGPIIRYWAKNLCGSNGRKGLTPLLLSTHCCILFTWVNLLFIFILLVGLTWMHIRKKKYKDLRNLLIFVWSLILYVPLVNGTVWLFCQNIVITYGCSYFISHFIISPYAIICQFLIISSPWGHWFLIISSPLLLAALELVTTHTHTHIISIFLYNVLLWLLWFLMKSLEYYDNLLNFPQPWWFCSH